jgi:hypothetical protein
LSCCYVFVRYMLAHRRTERVCLPLDAAEFGTGEARTGGAVAAAVVAEHLESVVKLRFRLIECIV